MNEDDKIRLIAECLAEIRDSNQTANNAIDHCLSELGKPIIGKTTGQAILTGPRGKQAPKLSLDDTQINYRYSEKKFGSKTVGSDIAFPGNNEDNPQFDQILQSLKTRKAAGEKIKPYWLFTDETGFGKNITK